MWNYTIISLSDSSLLAYRNARDFTDERNLRQHRLKDMYLWIGIINTLDIHSAHSNIQIQYNPYQNSNFSQKEHKKILKSVWNY